MLSVGAPSVGGAGVKPLVKAVSVAPMATSALTLADRQELLRNWYGPGGPTLRGYLNAGDTANFDATLLNYMRTRTNTHYYFEQSDVGGIVSFINGNSSLGNQRTTKLNRANDIVAHKFPDSVGSSSYTVQLPAGTVDWIHQPSSSVTTNTDFLYTLNQQFFWEELAMAYRLTGGSQYITELKNQLESWSAQYTRPTSWDDWIRIRPKWDLFTTSNRVKSWIYAYNMVLNSADWTPYANTEFLHRLLIQGQFMATTTKQYELTNNKATGHWTALYTIALLFPEYKDSASWLTTSTTKMFDVLNAQFRSDGIHMEQSPGYHGGAMGGFFDVYKLAELNGTPWSGPQMRRLRNIIEGFYQLLSPDGTESAISDTYRQQGSTFFTRASIWFGDTRWPRGRPRLDDVWWLGVTEATALLGNPTVPPLSGRGGTAYYPVSGYYVSRSGEDADARQVIFDAGPKGGDHGHYDLLNFEFYGYGKPLIADPGLLSYSSTYATDRAWVISTPAHNTISVDGKSHAASEKGSVAKLTLWSRKGEGVQMAATQYAYAGFAGNPVVARNLWHNRENIMLVTDFAKASTAHLYTQTFNLFTTATTRWDGTSIRTTTGSGDVMLIPLLLPGQTVSARSTILSNTAPPSGTTTGLRFMINQSGSAAATFSTLVVAFDNGVVPDVTAHWVRLPRADRSGIVQIVKDGVPMDLYVGMPDMSVVPNVASPKPASTTTLAMSMPPAVTSFSTMAVKKEMSVLE
jgi:hypothetical protein